MDDPTVNPAPAAPAGGMPGNGDVAAPAGGNAPMGTDAPASDMPAAAPAGGDAPMGTDAPTAPEQPTQGM